MKTWILGFAKRPEDVHRDHSTSDSYTVLLGKKSDNSKAEDADSIGVISMGE